MTSPHLRFWQGFASPSLSDRELCAALRGALIPMTTEVGARKGLVGYQPVLVKKHAGLPFLPDEIALVAYRNQALYEAIRATPEGARYGALHFKLDGVRELPGMADLEGREFFARDLGDGRRSSSVVAQTEPGFVAFGSAYMPAFGAEAVWRSAATLAKIRLRQEGIGDDEYLDVIGHYLKYSSESRMTEAHVVRIEERHLMEFIAARDAERLDAAMEDFDDVAGRVTEDFQTTRLTPLTEAESHGRKFSLTRRGEGMGYRLVFDADPIALPQNDAAAALALSPHLRKIFIGIAAAETAFDADS